MMDHDHYAVPENLPPDVQAAVQAAQQAHEYAHELEIEQRETLLRYAWLFCTCRPWPSRADGKLDTTPPQSGCAVHGSVMVTMGGRVL